MLPKLHYILKLINNLFMVCVVEELHGKLDEERFLFSQENESAACDVLDLMKVISVFHCFTQ